MSRRRAPSLLRLALQATVCLLLMTTTTTVADDNSILSIDDVKLACAEGWTRQGAKCLRAIAREASWARAEEFCKRWTIIHSAQSLFCQNKHFEWFSGYLGGGALKRNCLLRWRQQFPVAAPPSRTSNRRLKTKPSERRCWGTRK